MLQNAREMNLKMQLWYDACCSCISGKHVSKHTHDVDILLIIFVGAIRNINRKVA